MPYFGEGNHRYPGTSAALYVQPHPGPTWPQSKLINHPNFQGKNKQTDKRLIPPIHILAYS